MKIDHTQIPVSSDSKTGETISTLGYVKQNPSKVSLQSNSFISFDVSRKLDVSLYADGIFVSGLVGFSIIVLLLYKWLQGFNTFKDFELDETELGFGDQKFKLRINDDDRQIAYKIWVELSTRKIGLPIDLENDVISEVYDSWHTFFSVTRELIKDVPVRKYKRDSTEKIVRLSIEVLNEGLRPHLTKWQAKFRRWYERASANEDFGKHSPQEIQREFPSFEDLEKDMKQVNEKLIVYRRKMHELIKN